MTERLKEIVNWKERVLTAQAQRMADDAARITRDIQGVRAEHRGAMASFESVRRRARESSERGAPRSGRFYVDALRARLRLERGAVRKLEERLADGELRVSRVQREISTVIARLKRLQEIGMELRAEEAEGRERRAEEISRELWSVGGGGRGDLLLDGAVPSCGGNRGGEAGSVTEQGIRDGVVIDNTASVESTIDMPPSERRDPGTRGAAESEITWELGASSRGGAMGALVRPPEIASANSGAPERAGRESRAGSTVSPPFIEGRHTISEGASEGWGTAIERGRDQGVSLTYRSAAGSTIAVGIAQRLSGALDVEFHAERPGDRYRLERERRGLLESLRARGYEVERLVVSGIDREGREDGAR